MSVPTVLFVCVHKAGRSQMAAGYLAAIDARAERDHTSRSELIRRAIAAYAA